MSHRNHIHSSLHCFLRQASFYSLRILALIVLTVQAAPVYAVRASEPSRPANLSIVTVQDEQENRLLEPGKPPIKRDMSGADKEHKYHLALTAGEYVRIIVDQQGIDILVRLFSPDGKQVVEVDTTSRDGTQGPEDVRAVAGISGDYRLEVIPLGKTAKPGRYEVRIEELRAASQKDKDHVSAERVAKEASLLDAKGDVESRRDAAAKYEEAARLRHAACEIKLEGETLFVAGLIYTSLNNRQRALDNYLKARLILLSDESNPILAATLNELGKAYASLNSPEKALDYYKGALRLFQSQGLRAQVATTFNNIGQVYESLGNKEEALSYYKDKALPIMREFENHPDLPATLSNLGHLYYSMNEPEKALELYNEALPIFCGMKADDGEARTLNNIGQVKGGQAITSDEALEDYRKALSIFQKLGDISNEVITLGNVGTLYESLGRKEDALKSYLEGIEKLERLRTSVTIEELQAGVTDSLALVYKASLLHMSMGQGAQAFNLTELARARTFLDQVGNVRLDVLQTTDELLIKDRQQVESEISNLERAIDAEGGPRPESVKDYEAAQHLYEDLLVRYKLANPAYASSRSVKTLSVTDVQRQLDKDTTLLSYFVGPDETLAFVITQNSFRAVRIWVKDKELIKEIAWFRAFPNLGNSPAAAPDLSVTLKQLYNQLIAPVRPYLKTRTVAIIPHRELHFLPFAALTDGLHYFGAQHTLFYLPSASALPYIKREVPGTRMFALAQSRASRYPRLYYADAEAKTVAGLYNTQPLTTGTTSKSEFLKQSADYSLIHIAAHARQDTVSPLFYGISLGADKDHTEKLEVREIYQLNLSQTSLVVLSACHSDWGIPTQGDDVIALDRAFLYAGASTVIASLWLVDDKSTSELMASFYKYLKNGMSKAEALRAAQSDTRRKHPDPFYWASFVLTGDPGR